MFVFSMDLKFWFLNCAEKGLFAYFANSVLRLLVAFQLTFTPFNSPLDEPAEPPLAEAMPTLPPYDFSFEDDSHTKTVFAYGRMMDPEELRRVISTPLSDLRIQAAVLKVATLPLSSAPTRKKLTLILVRRTTPSCTCTTGRTLSCSR